MPVNSVIEVAALPAHGGGVDSFKGDDKKHASSGIAHQLPELCDPEASTLAETRPPLLVRTRDALSRSPVGRLFGMRVALDHTKKAAALAREEAVLSGLASWAARPIAQSFTELGSSAHGLNAKAAAQRLKLDGLNQVASSRKQPWWKLLISNIVNPFNAILVILAVVAISTSDHTTFIILMLMVFLSVTLRFIQEHKSANKVYALKSLIDNSCLVLGRGEASSSTASKLDRSQLVAGDVVRVSTGSVVPADCIVIASEMLTVSQSSLTGEGLPVEKYAANATPSLTRTSSAAPSYQQLSATANNDGSSATMDLPNLLFMGTHVVSGHADALVIATGDRTYVGTVACVSDESTVQNDFQRGISQISMLLLGFMFVMAPTVLIIDGFTTKDWKNAALFCLSVAVGLVPEMLPMVTTANLARGAILVARKKAIVKRLDAVQLLGAIDVLCSDKTGTLTEDHVTVASSCGPDGLARDVPLHLAYLNAKLQTSDFVNNIDMAILTHIDDEVALTAATETAAATEQETTAIVAQPTRLAERLLKDKTKVADIPFDFYRRVVSVVYQEAQGDHDKLHLVCKGAAEEVIRRCTYVRSVTADSEEGADATDKIDMDACTARIEAIAKRGERVIAVASRRVDRALLVNGVATPELEADMILEGFISILDPPKPDAKVAIAELRELGVQTKVLTGDALPTARRVCEILELLPETEGASELCITGVELSKLGPVEFARAVEEKCVFAKLTPIQKLEVVRALRVQGHQVAFLGDGVNDGPALRGSSCGISVNTGCDIAKDAADVILTQKNLDVIRDAIVIGRISFINTLKYIKMAASSNFGNVFSVTVAAAWLPFLPMSPTQILTLNLLYDISQASIPWDNVDEEMIQGPVNWSTKSMLKFMVCIGPISSPFDIFTFLVNWFYFNLRDPNDVLGVARFQTHWFLESALTQVAIVHVLRTAKFPFVQSRASWFVCATTFVIAVISFIAPYLPFLRSALGLTVTDPIFYAFLFPYSIAYVLIVQVAKVVYLKFNRVWL